MKTKSKRIAWRSILYYLCSNVDSISTDEKRRSHFTELKKHSFDKLKNSEFCNLSLESAKTKLSTAKRCLFEHLRGTGEINFIEIEELPSDRRNKLIWINDEKLKQWLNNLFNYHIKTQISAFHHSNIQEKSIFKLIDIKPRILLQKSISRWEAPQFPPKEYLSKRIYEFVTAEMIRNYH